MSHNQTQLLTVTPSQKFSYPADDSYVVNVIHGRAYWGKDGDVKVIPPEGITEDLGGEGADYELVVLGTDSATVSVTRSDKPAEKVVVTPTSTIKSRKA